MLLSVGNRTSGKFAPVFFLQNSTDLSSLWMVEIMGVYHIEHPLMRYSFNLNMIEALRSV